MNYDDLTPEQQEIWDAAQEESWDRVYDEGWGDGEDEGYSFGYNAGLAEGYEDGVKAEQKRIQDVLQIMFDGAINMGQGNKAVQYKHAMDLLRPIVINTEPDEDF